eukprot:3155979-Prymnesium_polylepis.1
MSRPLTRRLGDAGCRFVEGCVKEFGGLADGPVDQHAWEQLVHDRLPAMLGDAAESLERMRSAAEYEERRKSIWQQRLEWLEGENEKYLTAKVELERLKSYPGADNASALHWEDEWYRENVRNARLQAQVEILQETIR